MGLWAYPAFCAILHSLKHKLKCRLPGSLSKSSYQISPSRVKQGPKCRTKRNSCLLPPLQLHTRPQHGSTRIKKQHSECNDLMPLCSFRTIIAAISKQEHTTETAYNKHTPICFLLVRLMTMLHANEIPSVYIGKEQQAIDQSVPDGAFKIPTYI